MTKRNAFIRISIVDKQMLMAFFIRMLSGWGRLCDGVTMVGQSGAEGWKTTSIGAPRYSVAIEYSDRVRNRCRSIPKSCSRIRRM